MEYADATSEIPGLARRLAPYPKVRDAINRRRRSMGLVEIPVVKFQVSASVTSRAAESVAKLKAALARR